MRPNKSLTVIVFTACMALPGLYAALAHVEMSAPLQTLFAGGAILAASFLLLWACEAAQADIPQTLALAVVALIAVLPEYAVDMYFTWQAGRNPGAGYEHYAIANMTGANRLIIGVAWTLVVGIFWYKTRRAVVLDSERQLEIRFLAAATVYALFIPLKGSLAWYDGVFFIGLYAWYIVLASRRPQTEFEAEGPAAWIVSLAPGRRRATFISMFIFSAFVIVANAERFSEGLLGTGKAYGINEFLLVQWLAPIASEAPEFVVAIMFALRGQASRALGSLLSSKLNQWNLPVGMNPRGVCVGQWPHHPDANGYAAGARDPAHRRPVSACGRHAGDDATHRAAGAHALPAVPRAARLTRPGGYVGRGISHGAEVRPDALDLLVPVSFRRHCLAGGPAEPPEDALALPPPGAGGGAAAHQLRALWPCPRR